MTKHDVVRTVRSDLAKALRRAVADHEVALQKAAEKEAIGLCKASGCIGEIHKCGDMSAGKTVKGEMGEDGAVPMAMAEIPASPGSGGEVCPGCGEGSPMHVGDMRNRSHFLCVGGCGLTFSRPAGSAEGQIDDPLHKVTPPDISEETAHKIKAEYGGDKSKAYATMWSIHNKKKRETKKAEPSPDGYIDVTTGEAQEPKGPGTLPGDKKSKEIDAEGSGGDTKKGKLQKDATDMAFGVNRARSKMPAAGLPGMTPNPKTAPHPETQATLADLKALRPGGAHPAVGQSIGEAKELRQTIGTAPTLPGGTKAGAPFVDKGGKALPFVRKPGATDPDVVAAGKARHAQAATDLAADKKAAGVGFLSNLITKFRGIGNKGWETARGAGPATASRAAGRMATRMAMAETPMDKATAEEANKEIQGFQSLVHKPPMGTRSAAAVRGKPAGTTRSASAIRGTPSTGIKVPSFIRKAITKNALAKTGTGIPAMPGMPKMPAAPTAKAPTAPGANPSAPMKGAKPAGVAAPTAKTPKA